MAKTRALRVLTAVLLAFLAGRGAAQDNKTIYGDDDRRDYYQVSEAKRKLADSTVALFEAHRVYPDGQLLVRPYGDSMNLCEGEPFREQTKGAFCSGSLVGPDLVLTAGHCVENEADCANTKLVFGFAVKAQGQRPARVSPSEIYSCKGIVARKYQSAGEDYALLKLDRKVVGHVPLEINRGQEAAPGTALFIIGHPSGLPVKISGGASVRGVSGFGYFVADTDSYAGNSGSAVFNARTGLVEGILVRGKDDFVWQGNCLVSNRIATSGAAEQAVSISEVAGLIPYQEPGGPKPPQPPVVQPPGAPKPPVTVPAQPQVVPSPQTVTQGQPPKPPQPPAPQPQIAPKPPAAVPAQPQVVPPPQPHQAQPTNPPPPLPPPAAPPVQNTQLNALLAGLDSGDYSVRLEAANALGRMGPAARPALPKLILMGASDNDIDVARASRAAWSRIGADQASVDKAMPGLLALFSDQREIALSARMRTVKTLGDLGPLAGAAVHKLLAVSLTDRDTVVRQAAKAACQAIGVTRAEVDLAMPTLLTTLNSPNWEARLAAAQLLGGIGPMAAAAAPRLAQIKNDDPDRDVRQAASEALAAIYRAKNVRRSGLPVR